MVQKRIANNIGLFIFGSILLLLVIAFWGLYLKTSRLSAKIDKLSRNLDYSPSPNLQVGKIAPDFVLLSTKNEEISLADFQGQKTLLVFFSPTCGVCKNMLPGIKRLSQKIKTVLISYGTQNENQQFVESEEIEFQVLNWDKSVADQFNVSATPTFFLIDANLKIENSGVVDNFADLEKFCKQNQ